MLEKTNNKRLCSIIASISHGLGATPWSPWKIFKEGNGLLKNLGIGELRGNHKVFTFVCRIYNVYITDSIDAARLTVLQDRETRSNGTNKWCAPFSLSRREYTIKRWFGEMPTAPHLSSLRPRRCSLYWWQNWYPYQTVASRWSTVRIVNNARLVAANVRNQDCDAHHCVHEYTCQHHTDDQTACMNRHSWRLNMVTESCSRMSAYPK